MEFDVVIVGAGPAGLAAAIRLKQLAPDLGVVVVEKGSEVGAHILSGAVIDPIGLDRLLPEWRTEDTPIKTAVRDDRFYWLGQSAALRLPNIMMPPLMSNHGNFIVSLGNVCRWLATKAEALGVEIYPGFAAAEVLTDDSGAVAGVATGDMGIGKDGKPRSDFTRGMELRAKYTLFAEGARGNLSKQLIAKYRPRRRARAAEVRPGLEGALAGRAGQAPAGAGAALVRLAARQFHRRRLVPLSLRRQSGVGRLRGSSQLRQSLSVAVRGIPALQDPSAHPRHVRGRQAAVVRRARHHRGRLSVGAEAVVPGRRADRLRRGLRQRAAHQGQPQRHPVGNAGRRARRRGAVRGPRQRRARELRRGVARRRYRP